MIYKVFEKRIEFFINALL